MAQCHLFFLFLVSVSRLTEGTSGTNVTEVGVVKAAPVDGSVGTAVIATAIQASTNHSTVSAATAPTEGHTTLVPSAQPEIGRVHGNGLTVQPPVAQTPGASGIIVATAATSATLAGTGANTVAPSKDATGKMTMTPIKGSIPAYLHHQEYSPHSVEISRVIKIIALISNVLLQLSPIRTVREIRQAGSTMEYDALPMFTLFFGSLQWFLYAFIGLMLTSNTAMIDVMHAYILGVIMGAFYVYSFYQNCSDAEKSKAVQAMFRGGIFLLGFELLCVLLLSSRNSMRILGTICAFFSIMVGASPMVAIEEIFRTQSVAVMQTDMVIVNFCGSCAWASMGFLMNDMCIAIPNSFGIVIGGIQVHLIVKFAETGLWKNNANDGAAAPLKGPSGGYEASVYTHLKVFILLSVAHARFVLANYASFAANTLGEAYAYMLELHSLPRSRCGCSMKRCVSASRGGRSEESLDLL